MADEDTPIPLERQPARMFESTQKKLRKIADGVVRISNEIKALADKKNALRADAKALGVPKKAFDDALRYWQADAEQRDSYDAGYQATRAALEVPVPLDLFEAADRDEERTATPPTPPEPPAAASPAKGAKPKTSTDGDKLIKEVAAKKAAEQSAREQSEGGKILAAGIPSTSGQALNG